MQRRAAPAAVEAARVVPSRRGPTTWVARRERGGGCGGVRARNADRVCVHASMQPQPGHLEIKTATQHTQHAHSARQEHAAGYTLACQAHVDRGGPNIHLKRAAHERPRPLAPHAQILVSELQSSSELQ